MVCYLGGALALGKAGYTVCRRCSGDRNEEIATPALRARRTSSPGDIQGEVFRCCTLLVLGLY